MPDQPIVWEDDMTPSEQSYREIKLTQGQIALVDISDFDWLNQWKWCARWSKHTESFYAIRGVYPTHETIYMHRLILGLEKNDPRKGDHRFRNTLDNRRFIDGKSNLRVATYAQNAQNASVRYDNKLGIKGVSWHKHTKKWAARIMLNKKAISLGYFHTIDEAKAAYRKAAFELHGEFSTFS